MEVTDCQYEKIEKQIQIFEKNKSKYKFNILGLAYIFFDKEIHRTDYFYCAEFIKHVLYKADLNVKLPNMPRPEDFEKIKNSKLIYTGLLKHYKAVEFVVEESA